jgi:5-methyltetrahydrofolate--homocysteine methyltransferase
MKGNTMFDKLMDAITQMQEEEALELTEKLLEAKADPVAILDACTKAMEEVGKKFESGVYFLPELMMAGEMLKQISEKVKPMIQGKGEGKKAGKVLLGTVRGDIHDIGKDIVGFLLDVNGFEVKDIGIDVPPETFVKEAETFHPDVVAMSGLLTLAYDSMKDTVDALKTAGLRDSVKIIIGGGQMSDKIAGYSGADACAKDAMDGVNLIKNWTKKE